MPGSLPDRDTHRERATSFVVHYRWPAGRDADVRRLYPAHRADVDRLGAEGGLWMIGTLPETDGWSSAVAVFRTEAAARTFVEQDPLFTTGLATASSVQPWRPLTFPS